MCDPITAPNIFNEQTAACSFYQRYFVRQVLELMKIAVKEKHFTTQNKMLQENLRKKGFDSKITRWNFQFIFFQILK